MVQKRGQLSMPQMLGLLVIVIIIIVLVLNATGDSFQLSKLFTKSYAPSNVQAHIGACRTSCNLHRDAYDFCINRRTVRFGEDVSFNGENVDSVSLSCHQLSQTFGNLGFEPCPNLC